MHRLITEIHIHNAQVADFRLARLVALQECNNLKYLIIFALSF